MEEWRRLGYLTAMGIRVWEVRLPAMAMALKPAETARPELAAEPDPPSLPLADLEPVVASETSAVVVEEGALIAGPVLSSSSQEGDAAPHDAWALVQGGAQGAPAGVGVASTVQTLDWDGLAARVAGCRACGLCESRTQTVFGVGNRAAELMIIGEAPGADEDRAGEPFVGRAGQLLNRMLVAIGLAREQVYIANVLKCRPPGNRDPKPEEVLQCQDFLTRQIALVQPRLILSVGRVSAQQLLRTETPVGRLRGRWFEDGPGGIPLRVTYHPAYLLRSPEQKAKAWEDLTEVRRRLDTEDHGIGLGKR